MNYKIARCIDPGSWEFNKQLIKNHYYIIFPNINLLEHEFITGSGYFSSCFRNRFQP